MLIRTDALFLYLLQLHLFQWHYFCGMVWRAQTDSISVTSPHAPVPFGWPFWLDSKGTKKAFVGFCTGYPERFYSPSWLIKTLKIRPGFLSGELVGFFDFDGENIARRVWFNSSSSHPDQCDNVVARFNGMVA
ncbi:hypothetical protein P4S72_27435 [Vibrio sp. PP-XX7]